MKTIVDNWTEYERKVMPRDVSQIQYQETKRAFYAASYAIIIRLLEQLNDGEDVVAYLESLLKECYDFKDLVAAGLA